MIQEEKAKAYDEALKRARKELRTCGPTDCDAYRQIIRLFPELKESEDERIRKAIKKALQVRCGGSRIISDEPVTLEEALAWLEKQGKEEYALKSFSDKDVHKFMQYIEKQAKAYEFNLPNRGYDIYAFTKDILYWLEKQGEQREQLINKACDILVNCIEDFMLRRMEVWDDESKKRTLENIRKKLEE